MESADTYNQYLKTGELTLNTAQHSSVIITSKDTRQDSNTFLLHSI